MIYFPIQLVLLQSSPIAKTIKNSNNRLNSLLHKLNHPTIDPLILCHCNHHQSGKIVKHSFKLTPLNLLPHLSFATAITIISSQEHKALFETLQDCANWVRKWVPSICCVISRVIAFAIIINSEKRSWNWSLKILLISLVAFFRTAKNWVPFNVTNVKTFGQMVVIHCSLSCHSHTLTILYYW